MKRIFILILLSFSMTAFAQQITMVDTAINMSKGIQPAIQISIPHATAKALKRDWLKYMDNASKEKSVETGNEILLPEVFIPNISPNSFKIYSTFNEATEGTKLTVWVTPDNVVFYSKEVNVDQYNAIKMYLYDFSLSEYRQVVLDGLNSENNKSADLEKELSKLIKDHEKALKTISENEGSIQKANDEILVNKGDIKTLSTKISNQKNMVDKTASDENANKGALKTLKELEKEKEDLQDANDTNNKRIISWNKEIRDNERDIVDLIEKKALKEEEIRLQKEKVQVWQLRFDTLK